VEFTKRSVGYREMEIKDTDRKLNILIAEDDELNRILLCEILGKYGCTYKAADNGRTAVDLFLEEHFDLILLDMHMPVMDGFEAARAVREIENESFGHTPIAVLSASALMDDKEKDFSREMDYHLMKPYYPKEIYKLLDQLAAKTGVAPGRTANTAGSPETTESKVNLRSTWRPDHLSSVEMHIVFEKMDCDAQFFESLLEKFKDSSAELLDKIRDSISAQNCEALIKYIHALKGELHIFNAAVPVRIAEALERVSRTGIIPDSAETVAAKLEEDVREIIESYTAFIRREKGSGEVK
jgi:CheY-like chemotaxis protein/HPt (histidine-containing phosphotransfer) domain-containing protein